MDKSYSHRIIDGDTSHWTFLESATAETFQDAFESFYKTIRRPEIDRLVVELKMPDSYLSKEIQEIWLKTGEVAQNAGIVKWGIVADWAKVSALRYLARGGAEGGRTYEYLVSESLDDVRDWIRRPCQAPQEPGVEELLHAPAS